MYKEKNAQAGKEEGSRRRPTSSQPATLRGKLTNCTADYSKIDRHCMFDREEVGKRFTQGRNGTQGE